jgi:three-Cys-motif partner protein
MKRHREPKSRWGGDWTEKKIEAFVKYVSDYLSITRRNPLLKTIYFDGFAGSGERKSNIQSELYEQLMITEAEEKVYKGSAERVLNLPRNAFFDFYYFADNDSESLSKLEERLCASQGQYELQFCGGDCNEHILELSKTLKRESSYFAFLVLDPFDMQIKWESIAALKNTRTDIWILVPTVVIVNILLDKNGELRNFHKLQPFFGMSEKEIKSFFSAEEEDAIQLDEKDTVKKINRQIEKIAGLYVNQLKTIWANVIEEPICLKNPDGTNVLHFIYASNNTNTLKIAKEIIRSA